MLADDVRLVTLTGPSGVGKTRLALEAGAQGSVFFARGVRLIDLASIRDPSLVPAAIAHGLGLMDTRGDPIRGRLVEYLRDRHTLIILDNFEQVLGAASFVADLVAHCPGVTLLVTSRGQLHILWEHSVQVQPLPVPDPSHLPSLEELVQMPSVALFLERVRAINVGFALSEVNAATVAEQAAPALMPAGQSEWFFRLERDYENVRAALRWFEESGQTERQLRLATAVWYFWWTRGYMA